MRDVFLEWAFAGLLLLLLWLYYRYLEHVDSKGCREHKKRKRREEQEGSVSLPEDLQWRGTVPGGVLREEHYLEPRFSTGRMNPARLDEPAKTHRL